MGIENIRAMKEAAKLPKEKKKYYLPKKSAKKLAQEKAEKDENGDTELQKWFRARMKHMTGKCSHYGCTNHINTKVYREAIKSICHILPKRETMFPSVRTHPLNFIELCWQHHHEFDNTTWGEKLELPYWNKIEERLVMMFPDIDEKEKRLLPQFFLDFMANKEPF